MTPAGQASRRTSPGRELVAGAQDPAGPEPAFQGVQGHGDHHGGVDPGGLGEPLGGVALQQLTQRLPVHLRGRDALRAGSGEGGRGWPARPRALVEHGAVQDSGS